MTSRRFASVMLEILTKSISIAAPISIGALSLGCGIDTDGFSRPTCSADGSLRYLTGISTAAPVDYMELRSTKKDTGGNPVTTVIESTGEKCKGATDAAACGAAIAAATSATGFEKSCFDFNCSVEYVVVQSGDNVNVIATREAFRVFVLPIDTPNEAVVLASLSGYSVACSNPDEGGIRAASDGYEVLGTKLTSSCDPIETSLFLLNIDKNGTVTEADSEVIESTSGACIGRRPAGLKRQKAKGSTRIGAHFGSIAHLEAASVDAFEQLAEELSRHGAPESLVRRAHVARKDEVRHARVMKRFAERHGGLVPSPRIQKQKERSLEAIALDNAVEGCVRETFGALVGEWQSRFSEDPALRRAMRRVARDEMRHAALSWAIDAWIRPRLSPEARQRVDAAQAEALQAVAEEAALGHDHELVMRVGLPDARAASALASSFLEAFPRLALSIANAA